MQNKWEKDKENKRILGIDYGSKRIGVAMTDSSGAMALPHSVVSNSHMAMNDIIKICIKNGVNKIVIGESKDFSGKHNPIMNDIKKFAHNLEKETGSQVVFHPEFMTSQQAERLQGKNEMIDASAATLILQSFLDTKN